MTKKEMNHNFLAYSYCAIDDLNEREKNIINDFDQGNLNLSISNKGAEAQDQKDAFEGFDFKQPVPRRNSSDLDIVPDEKLEKKPL